jgi:hypothetical protein
MLLWTRMWTRMLIYAPPAVLIKFKVAKLVFRVE